jgi:hypothetical protein
MIQPHIWNEYHDMMVKEFFNVCKDTHVLEIAPFKGHQTQAIVKYPVKSLTLVEPNRQAINGLVNNFSTAKVINDDIFKVYKSRLPADVVVACGLLYHLHSPLYLLELIANQSEPKYIILDCPHFNSVNANIELPNTPGNRYTTDNWKSVNYIVTLPFDYINQALAHLGYTCSKTIDLKYLNVFSKNNSWMGMWQKTN